MRVLLDESLPRALARELVGHDVQTVTRAGWSGFKNGDLPTTAAGSYDVVVTIDQRFAEKQSLPPTLAVITLSSPNNRIDSLRPLVPALLEAPSTNQPGQRVRLRV